jgi:hypothetical protein
MHDRYDIVFIEAIFIPGFFYIFFMPETKVLNLEEIAAVFGDVVVSDGKEAVGEEERPECRRWLMLRMPRSRSASASHKEEVDGLPPTGLIQSRHYIEVP